MEVQHIDWFPHEAIECEPSIERHLTRLIRIRFTIYAVSRVDHGLCW